MLACHPIRLEVARGARLGFARGGVAARVAEALAHLWSDRGADPFDIEPLRRAVALCSPDRELQEVRQHDAEIGFRTMLNELLRELDALGLTGARELVAMTPLLTRRCNGSRCAGTGDRGAGTAEEPTTLLPPVTVPRGVDLYAGADGFKLFLERSAGEQTNGQHPNTRCDGLPCDLCDPVPTPCECGNDRCNANLPGHRYQPFVAHRRMIHPPPVMFVPLSRTHWSDLEKAFVRSSEPVRLPTGDFDASALFDDPAGGAHYRVFGAIYHQGNTPHSGHYWAIVRGAGGEHALADDASVTHGPAVPSTKRYGSSGAARRVTLVGLERVDAGAAQSASERNNSFAPPPPGAAAAVT